MKFVKKFKYYFSTFFEEVFEEESRTYENDSAVSIAALTISAIALTGVAPAIDYRMKTMKDGMRLGESRVKSSGLKISSTTPGEGN